MPDQQDRLVLPGSVQADDYILLAIVWSTDVNVFIRKAGRTKSLRHGLRCGGHITDRIRGVDLNQLLENVMGQLLSGVVNLGVRIWNKHHGEKQQPNLVQVFLRWKYV